METITELIRTFSKDHKPCYEAEDGETLCFRTIDCFGGQVKTEADLVFEIDEETADLATGPVYVKGAQPGDVLVVDILDVEVDSQGACCAAMGPLAEDCEPRTRIFPVVNRVTGFQGLEWEVDPMIGVIGVAPAGEPVPCVEIGDHGGNMDSKGIKKGARVYFPVQVEGALLAMGDLHATMGDCEISGTGIEIGGRVTVRVSVIKNFPLRYPVTETREKWYVNCARQDYETALKDVCLEMRRLLAAAYGMDLTDAYIYMSAQCDIEINQFTLPCPIRMCIRAGVPKIPGKPLVK